MSWHQPHAWGSVLHSFLLVPTVVPTGAISIFPPYVRSGYQEVSLSRARGGANSFGGRGKPPGTNRHQCGTKVPQPQCPHCGRPFAAWHLAKRHVKWCPRARGMGASGDRDPRPGQKPLSESQPASPVWPMKSRLGYPWPQIND